MKDVPGLVLLVAIVMTGVIGLFGYNTLFASGPSAFGSAPEQAETSNETDDERGAGDNDPQRASSKDKDKPAAEDDDETAEQRSTGTNDTEDSSGNEEENASDQGADTGSQEQVQQPDSEDSGQGSRDDSEASQEDGNQAPDDTGPASQPASAQGDYGSLDEDSDPREQIGQDRETPEAAAADYIIATFGYTGDDVIEYREGVNDTIVYESFARSKGANIANDLAEVVEEGGANSAASLVDLDIRDQSESTVDANATFEMGGSYTESGEVTNDVDRSQQRIQLRKDNSVWKVSGAQETNRIENEGQG